jgi:hypothetical protein
MLSFLIWDGFEPCSSLVDLRFPQRCPTFYYSSRHSTPPRQRTDLSKIFAINHIHRWTLVI